MHMRCREWRDSFPCCRRSAPSDCLASRSASPLNRWLHQFANSRARRCSAHRVTGRRPTKSFTFGKPLPNQSSRRRLSIPVLVVTGARGRRELAAVAAGSASLSERGCLIAAQQSGHVVGIDQPAIVVDAIRTVVETARGHHVPLCATSGKRAITHFGDEAALIRPTETPPAGLRRLSQRLDPKPQSSHIVPTREMRLTSFRRTRWHFALLDSSLSGCGDLDVRMIGCTARGL